MEEYVTRWTQSISAFVPGVIGAVVLLLVAWLVSTMIRAVVKRIGRASQLDTRLHSPGITESHRSRPVLEAIGRSDSMEITS